MVVPRLPRVDVLHHLGACRGAVAPPELVAVGAVIGDEEEFSADGCQVGGIVVPRLVRVDVLHQLSAGRRPVASPELVAMGVVVGREVEFPVHYRQVVGAVGARGTRGLDDPGSGLGPVTPPQRVTATSGPVVGREVERPADVRQGVGVGAPRLVDVLHPGHRRGRPASVHEEEQGGGRDQTRAPSHPSPARLRLDHPRHRA